jgi:hypothetical protein
MTRVPSGSASSVVPASSSSTSAAASGASHKMSPVTCGLAFRCNQQRLKGFVQTQPCSKLCLRSKLLRAVALPQKPSGLASASAACSHAHMADAAAGLA